MSSSTRGDRTTPETPVDKLRQEFERLIDAVWTQGERAIDAVGLRPLDKSWVPQVDVVESHDVVQVAVDLPGVDASQLDISLLGNMLTIKGQRSLNPHRPEDVCHRRELPGGPFKRSIPLPVAVDPDKVVAETKNGVLLVTLSKEERIKPRQIRVDSQSSATGEAPASSGPGV